MRVSELIKNLQEYMEMHGDQPVFVYDYDNGHTSEITGLDGFQNALLIEIGEEDEQ